MSRQLVGHGAVEGDGHDLLVKILDLKLNIVRQLSEVDGSGFSIDQFDLFALLEGDPGMRKRCRNLKRRIMVTKKSSTRPPDR
jgi:hypothetical protein